MALSLVANARSTPTPTHRRASSVASTHHPPARAGEIGPVRREIIFEPVHEQPAPPEPSPLEPTPATPETQPQEPAPA